MKFLLCQCPHVTAKFLSTQLILCSSRVCKLNCLLTIFLMQLFACIEYCRFFIIHTAVVMSMWTTQSTGLYSVCTHVPGILRIVEWQFLTDLSEQPVFPFFKGQALQGESFFLDCLTLEGGTDRLSRNLCTNIPNKCRSYLQLGGNLTPRMVSRCVLLVHIFYCRSHSK